MRVSNQAINNNTHSQPTREGLKSKIINNNHQKLFPRHRDDVFIKLFIQTLDPFSIITRIWDLQPNKTIKTYETIPSRTRAHVAHTHAVDNLIRTCSSCSETLTHAQYGFDDRTHKLETKTRSSLLVHTHR